MASLLRAAAKWLAKLETKNAMSACAAWTAILLAGDVFNDKLEPFYIWKPFIAVSCGIATVLFLATIEKSELEDIPILGKFIAPPIMDSQESLFRSFPSVQKPAFYIGMSLFFTYGAFTRTQSSSTPIMWFALCIEGIFVHALSVLIFVMRLLSGQPKKKAKTEKKEKPSVAATPAPAAPAATKEPTGAAPSPGGARHRASTPGPVAKETETQPTD